MTLRSLRRLAAVLLLGGVAVAGCGKKADPTDKPVEAKPDAPTPSTVRKVDPEPAKATPAAPTRDKLHQTFADATRPSSDPPADSNRPPDALKSGKPVFKVLETVISSWDSIRFTDAAGKKINYTAEVHTDQGVIEIALFPEQAPNHVRNFIALARAGYFDGLCFDRSRQEATETAKFESLEGGCPVGLGEPGMGSIGYWLKDELTPGTTMSHDEGVIGACRSEEADTGACRFYICLSKAPFLDGNTTLFGKVVKGLDRARRIYQQPVVAEDAEKEGGRRPQQPVVIQKVTIHAN